MRRYLTPLLLFALVALACGQYPGAHSEEFGSVGGGVAVDTDGDGVADTFATDTDGDGVPDTTGDGTGFGGGGSGTGSGGGGSGPGSGGGGGGGGGGGDGGGGATTPPPGDGDSTGVTEETITIGIHAPITGAAPLRSDSFTRGKDLYWQNAGEGGGVVEIFGRQVQVYVEDDRYNPSYARLVCQRLIEEKEVFLLVGGGGTDQIQACAQLAASRGVPYLSSGVTQVGLNSLPNYFALSMSYAQQAPLLAQFIKKNFTTNGAEVAVVATNTPNFDDAVNAFTSAFPGVKVFRPDKNDRGSNMSLNLCRATEPEYEVVFPLVAPLYYLEMAHGTSCHPQYAGVGLTMGLDAVATAGCPDTEGAIFFSPSPAFADSDAFDERFRAAGGSDDVQWLLWGLSMQLHAMFAEAGPSLTRERFIGALNDGFQFDAPGVPALAYSSSSHFGAKQVNVIQNKCNPGRYVTLAADVSSF